MDPARLAAILIVGVACYLERAAPQFLRAERLVRGRLATWVQYVSLAAIAALGSSIAFPSGHESGGTASLGPRAAAMAVTIAVAGASRRYLWGIIAGMAAYLALGGLG